MKNLWCLFLCCSITAMDYTPPAVIPDALKRKIEDESHHEEMPRATVEALDIHRTSSKHRIHDVQTIVGTVGETRIDIKADKLHESDQDQNLISLRKRTLVITHALASLATGLIMTGVTLAVKYGDCKK